jgi:CRP-like cAMP-binding protein
MMQIQSLYEVLFAMKPLPQQIRNEIDQKNFIQYVDPKLESSHFLHRQLLLSAGQVADHIYFLESGFARGYYYNQEKEKEQTICLWDSASIITEPNSFFKRKKSDLQIEVMPGSRLKSISHHNLIEVFAEFPFAEIFKQCLALQYVSYQTERTNDFIGLSGWERYLEMLRRYPQIEQKVSKEIIASYLGITPQSLSRLLRANGHP